MQKKGFLAVLLFLIILKTFALGQGDTYKGEKLYQLKCGRCHFAYSPEKYSPEEWKTVENEKKRISPVIRIDSITFFFAIFSSLNNMSPVARITYNVKQDSFF